MNDLFNPHPRRKPPPPNQIDVSTLLLLGDHPTQDVSTNASFPEKVALEGRLQKQSLRAHLHKHEAAGKACR